MAQNNNNNINQQGLSALTGQNTSSDELVKVLKSLSQSVTSLNDSTKTFESSFKTLSDAVKGLNNATDNINSPTNKNNNSKQASNKKNNNNDNDDNDDDKTQSRIRKAFKKSSVIDERKTRDIVDAFMDGLYAPLTDFEDRLKAEMGRSTESFVNATGISMDQVVELFGRGMTNNVINIFKSKKDAFTDWADQAEKNFNDLGQNISDTKVYEKASSGINNFFSKVSDTTSGWVDKLANSDNVFGHFVSNTRDKISKLNDKVSTAWNGNGIKFNSVDEWQNAFNDKIKEELNKQTTWTKVDRSKTVPGPEGENSFTATPIDDITGTLKDKIIDQFSSGDFKGALDSIKGLGQSAVSATGGVGNLVKNFATLGLKTAAVNVAMAALQYLLEQVGGIFQGLAQIISAIGKAANRDANSRAKNLEYAQKRLQDDVNTLIKKPFEIMEKAAQDWYDAWDNNLRTINQTQGYNKQDLEDLMANYATRVNNEGLSGEVSSADIVNNLTKVLQGGLTGQAAEEFAYQATKLNAAIPTQDFFSYASSYASIIANAEKSGQNATEALNTANNALETFASGILQAERATGGLTTTLTDASSVFNEAVKIAQAARTYDATDINNIASTLLAIESEVGAVAPDLASSLTEKIYSLMTGGNSDDLVALRSLAGVNASNTDFIQEFVKNPQEILSDMFRNLGQIFSQSSDAYMEKAEGYSQLFGVSSETFQRVDFTDLANTISSMDASTSSLQENMELLKSGQTTTNENILKNQEVNKYILDNGLSLVLDNEAGRQVQQHMWDEQEARQLMEATYGVELAGESRSGLLKIVNAVSNILNLLNPFAWGKKIANAVTTSTDTSDLKKDIKEMLQLGAVGGKNSYNAKALSDLTSYNKNLNLTSSYVKMLGEATNQNYTEHYDYYRGYENHNNLFGGIVQDIKDIYNAVKNSNNTQKEIVGAITSGTTKISSQYDWGQITKSQGYLANQYLKNAQTQSPQLQPLKVTTVTETGTASSQTLAKIDTALQRMLSEEYIQTYIKNGTGYKGWAASAGQNGITDLDEALESAGYNQTDIETAFTDRETQYGVDAEAAHREKEEEFWKISEDFYQTDFPKNWQDPALQRMDQQIEELKGIEDKQVDWKQYFDKNWMKTLWPQYFSANGNSGFMNKWFTEFYKKFITNEYYTSTKGYDYKEVSTVQAKKKKSDNGDVVYALAEMLTKNALDLKDPQVQANAILAQILIVVNAIQNQNNKVAGTEGTSKLLESLQSMALGMTATTT